MPIPHQPLDLLTAQRPLKGHVFSHGLIAMLIIVILGCHPAVRREGNVSGDLGTISPVQSYVPAQAHSHAHAYGDKPGSRDATAGHNLWQWRTLDHHVVHLGSWDECYQAWCQQRLKEAGVMLPNLPFPTLGGKQVWRDRTIRSGWRIQQHSLTGHFRLLDAKDIRRAWGSEQACVAVLDQHQPPYDSAANHNQLNQLWLLPGIWRSKDAMKWLAHDAAAAGWDVRAVNYPSITTDLADHADQLQHLLSQHPTTGKRVILTHSMGGLVVRQAQGNSLTGEDNQLPSIDAVIMLFPPNQGAHKANQWHRRWWYRWAMGPAGQQLRSDIAANLPSLECPTYIIAGGTKDGNGRSTFIPGNDDGTVAVSETYLPNMTTHVTLPVGHTFGMNDSRLRAQVQDWLHQIKHQ